ncbi:hypothetical protein FIU87_16215 [Bacillus sp. THAF10]|uniref:hypothetical protein n=1 Tax=Bacillus sp. THAF10 TaxID=2587848 RepID=UPI0012690A98|nr:hypothetical protein [Bacillus sp. THAF10]QFT90209.1 hypothetical protein FIU87_16215 [Bacillus sp. THAF10]
MSRVINTEKNNSKYYFIYKIQEFFNDHHNSLKKKRLDSLVFLFEECNELLEEIAASAGNKDRLEKILLNLYDNIEHVINYNPIYKHEFFKKDIQKLLSRIKGTETNPALHHTVSSFTKRLKNYDFMELYIDLLKNKNLSFGEVDRLIECIVSDLVNRGFSLKYLSDWWISNIKSSLTGIEKSAEELEGILDNFKKIHLTKSCFKVIIRTWLPNGVRRDLEDNGYINTQDITYKSVGSDLKSIVQDNFTGLNDNKKQLLQTEIYELDEYKAINNLSKIFIEYIQIYKHIEKFPNNIFDNTYLLYVGEKWEKKRLDISLDNDIFKLNERFKEDIKDFIELRKLSTSKSNQFDIITIERALNTINSFEGSSEENKLLNFWYSTEYIVGILPKSSIIEKVRNIIPKVICLYLLKDKINILWDRIEGRYYKKREKGNLHEELPAMSLFFERCSYTDESGKVKYKKNNILDFLSDKTLSTCLYYESKDNIIIQREIADINFLLKDATNILEFMTYTEKSIKFDLNRIYRIRNKLVHSGGLMPPNLNIITARLFAYVNSLLGTLIYHMKRNPELTIIEILYSIQDTYEWYTRHLASDVGDSKMEVAMPKYLFL